jgi:hypothetical protein
MDIRKEGQRTVTIHSSPPGAPAPRQNVQALLPAFNKPAAPGKNILFDTPTHVTAGHLVMREVDRTKHRTEFDFTDGVKLSGGGLDGHCDRLGVLADMTSVAKNNRLAPLSRIHNMTATGNVSLATKDYKAEGGEAVVLPSVTVREHSPLDDNGLDGPAPQFLVLRPHPSTPGKRPRLTFFSSHGLKGLGGFGDSVPSSEKPATTPKPASAPAPKLPSTSAPAVASASAPASANTPAPIIPFHVDGDLLEVIGGAVRSRFLLRGNVVLSGPDIVGHCDAVEGSIIQEVPAKKPVKELPVAGSAVKPPEPQFAVTRVVGTGGVRMLVKEDEVLARSFEFLPMEDKIYLTGSPRLQAKNGMRMFDSERIMYNRVTKGWEPVAPRDGEGRISWPTITIPLNSSFTP